MARRPRAGSLATRRRFGLRWESRRHARFRAGRRSCRSSVAQWQSIRLLTGGLLVRVQPEEPTSLREVGHLGLSSGIRAIRCAARDSARVQRTVRGTACAFGASLSSSGLLGQLGLSSGIRAIRYAARDSARVQPEEPRATFADAGPAAADAGVASAPSAIAFASLDTDRSACGDAPQRSPYLPQRTVDLPQRMWGVTAAVVDSHRNSARTRFRDRQTSVRARRTNFRGSGALPQRMWVHTFAYRGRPLLAMVKCHAVRHLQVDTSAKAGAVGASSRSSAR